MHGSDLQQVTRQVLCTQEKQGAHHCIWMKLGPWERLEDGEDTLEDAEKDMIVGGGEDKWTSKLGQCV